MAWQKNFDDFKSVFHKFSESLHRKDLSKQEQEELIANLNLTVEKGWVVLQKFMHEKTTSDEVSMQSMESISENGFSSSLASLKRSFEKNENVQVKHDRQYLVDNEWEVREVVYPAFKELHDFLENQQS